MINELYDFTIPTYIKFLHYIKKHYQIIPLMRALKYDTPYLVLRHDVDYSLDAAARMAKIEYDADVEATYAFLFSSKHYNLLERNALKSLRLISSLGHEVALHYDLKMYREYGVNLGTTLKQELNLLKQLVGKPVKSIVMHQIGLEQIDPFKNYPDVINGFNKDVYNLYITDSYRAWYRESLKKLFSFKYDKVQLLIHPSVWTDEPTDRNEVLRQLDEEEAIVSWGGNLKIKENDEFMEI